MSELESATIGIITAVPEEFAAVCQMLNCGTEIDAPGKGAGRKYAVATLKAKTGHEHVIAVAQLTGMGNNSAAIRATQMVQHCPNLEHIVMVGIAGAVPNPGKPQDHVRLGDIVVSDRNGVIQYDFVKEGAKITENRHPPRPPGAVLVEAVQWITAKEMQNERPWEAYLKQAMARLGRKWQRPNADTDVLQDKPAPAQPIPHPKDPDRKRGQPRVFHGPIASANKLLKNPETRDALRDKFSVKAVEMEGSGIADASWNLEKGYLVIRGACDYCNPDKGDAWHMYAALAAAAYVRCLIEVLGTTDPKGAGVRGEPHQRPNRMNVADPNWIKGIKRKRDLEQLERLFYWLHGGVLDEFIDRLGYGKLTYVGGDFFEGFKSVVQSSKFKLYDKSLEARIRKLFVAWSECFRYAGIMDAHPNKAEAHLRMPMDMPVSEEQRRASVYLPKTAGPLSHALRSLQNYVRDEYLEIDLSKSGEQALAAYRRFQNRADQRLRIDRGRRRPVNRPNGRRRQ